MGGRAGGDICLSGGARHPGRRLHAVCVVRHGRDSGSRIADPRLGGYRVVPALGLLLLIRLRRDLSARGGSAPARRSLMARLLSGILWPALVFQEHQDRLMDATELPPGSFLSQIHYCCC